MKNPIGGTCQTVSRAVKWFGGLAGSVEGDVQPVEAGAGTDYPANPNERPVMETAHWIIVGLILLLLVQDAIFGWAFKAVCDLQKQSDKSHAETLRLLDAAVSALNGE